MTADEWTTADRAALLAIELGMALTPWQFDALAALYDNRDNT